MRMMRFRYAISHVPGKELAIADALSRAPVSQPTTEDHLLQKETSAFVNAIIQSLLAAEKRREEIKQHQQADKAFRHMVEYCNTQWPVKRNLPGVVKPYYPVASEISYEQGLLMRGNRIVIPPSLHSSILDKLHAGHKVL